jgi:uncharacterized protein (DUF1697 family)
MTRYIAFLRALNVGANRRVTMERLRALFGELELARVGSYIQTGNVFFDTDEPDREALRARIEAHLESGLGFAVPAFLRTVEEVAVTIALNPFADREITPDMRPAITFTREPFPPTVELPYLSPKGDLEVVHATEGEVFTIWHLINGRPPAADLPKGMLTGPATTRFFGATTKILAAAQK